MNFKRSPFSIHDKNKGEIDYVKAVYKKKIQFKIEFYKDPQIEDKRKTIQAKDKLMLDWIIIQSSFFDLYVNNFAIN